MDHMNVLDFIKQTLEDKGAVHVAPEALELISFSPGEMYDALGVMYMGFVADPGSFVYTDNLWEITRHVPIFTAFHEADHN